ncbi:MAG: hypothetical protein NTX63_02970 [Candidatus Peregrinibacteria bacterium]|nr:hypothetical protein [Candidatus Peregrinibacteria bacterium]
MKNISILQAASEAPRMITPSQVSPDTPQEVLVRILEECSRALLEAGETIKKDDTGHDETYSCDGDDGSEKKYFYFPAGWHGKCGLVTAPMIANLQSGASLLSVGSGPAHLERVLHRGLGVQNITLSDIYLHPRALKSGLPCHQFDMTKPWPQFERNFDYIIFPESFGLNYKSQADTITEEASIPKDFYRKGDEPFRQSFSMYTSLSSAVRALNSDGKIMITYPLYSHELEFFRPRLLEHVPPARFVDPQKPRVTIIERVK